jgi:hypothetical protein
MRLAKPCLAFVLISSAALASAALAAPAPSAQLTQEGPGGFTLKITIPEPIRTLRELPEGGTFLEVAIPGFLPGSSASSGQPDLPQRGFPFGLPDGATARVVRTRTQSSTTFDGPPPLPVPHRRVVRGSPIPTQEYTYTPEPTAYSSRGLFPSEVVELGPVMGWRHQRIQTLIVHPVQVAPGTGSYRAVTEIEVEVRFELDRAEPRMGRRVPVRQDAPGWDEIVDKVILNPTTARTFRTRPAPTLRAPVVQPGDVNVRVRLGGTGLCRILYSDLDAAGWPSGIPVGEVRLEEHSYDDAQIDPFITTNLPRRIEDTNTNGVFDDGDFLVFYGFNFADRFNPRIFDSRFSYFHAYWVHAGAGGLDYPVTDGYPAGTYTVLPSFPFTTLNEENLIYTHNPLDSGSGIFPIYDSFYWLGTRDVHGPQDGIQADFPFTVVDLAPGAMFSVRARWQGNDTNCRPNPTSHIVSLDLNGTRMLDNAVILDRFPFSFTGTPMPAVGILTEGTNTMTIRGVTLTCPPSLPDTLYSHSGARFDWFEITHDRLLTARNDQLVFNSQGQTGDVEFVVTGFTSPDILVLDITDPANQLQMMGLVESAGGTYTVKLRVNVSGGPRTFLAAVPASVTGLPPSKHPLPPDLESQPVTLGLPRDLLVAGDGSDFILITHPNFEATWAPLVAHREAQGHKVFLCDVWEIYDQFAGGDKTAWAIQRFLTQAYRNWDPSPSFLLLGGDGSEDYRNDTPDADPDWVPTMMHFANVPGTAGLELAGTDPWYAAFLRQGDLDSDVIPDMHVGRLPVGSVQETQDMVQKIVDYESMDPADDWRNRGFFLADDQYSKDILDNFPYCWQSSEGSFKAMSQAMCDSIQLLGRLPDFDCVPYFLGDQLDTVATLYRDPGNGDCPVSPDPIGAERVTQIHTRANLTPAVIDSLTRGWLIWEFSGHGNKNQMTHEILLQHYPEFSIASRDLDKVNNFGKPFLFMGYACHLAEFEGSGEKEKGESAGEVMLLLPNRGAIAVMASTAFEWLHTNEVVQTVTTRPLFWDLPRDPNGRPRRLFGEAVNRGLTQLILENPTRRDFRGMVRTYQVFSDPALRVDIQTSAFQVEVDGTPWQDGNPLTADSFTDSLSVQAVVSDDVDVSSIRVFEGSTELPSGRIVVTPPLPTEQGSQFYQVAFKNPLRLGTYDLVLEAIDWAGRASSFALPVRFETRFKADDVVLDPAGNNVVDPSAVIRIEVTSPVPLTPSSFQLVVDGVETVGTITEANPTQWVIEVGGSWAGGDHTVELQVSAAGAECIPDPCPLVRSVTFNTSDPTAPLSISGVYFYPNPAEEAPGSLVYSLNRNAPNGQLTIYSVSGRRVLRVTSTEPGAYDLPLTAGTNSFRWDFRDQRGDEVANGIYLMVLTMEGFEGDILERVAVTR